MERSAGDAHSTTAGEKMNDDYRIQELLQRDVYVGDTFVGVITGERFHPRDECVQSLRIKVVPGVAEEYMRKAADCAPLSKELVHSIRPDGAVKLSKSMRELQRRWRNTVRISEELFAPDELLDRAVLDNQGMEIGVITDLVKIKRTYRAVVVKTRIGVQMQYGIDNTINIPITALARTRERLDEVVLSRTFDKLLGLPSYIQANDPDAVIEE